MAYVKTYLHIVRIPGGGGDSASYSDPFTLKCLIELHCDFAESRNNSKGNA